MAESGRVDTRVGGNTSYQDWLGRIFHVKLTNPGNKPTASVLVTPELKLAKVSDPVFKNPDPKSKDNEYPHSKENYEGMACLHLNKGVDKSPKYLVVLGERGGEVTGTGTLYWGEYDTGQALATREIKWNTASGLKGIVAPGKGRYSAAEWRDITGLHIDDTNRLYATAVFDSNVENPPYNSVMYQLGVICIDASDKHGASGLCDYTASPRPVILENFTISASSDHHKFETVAAPSGRAPKPDSLSIAAEDEDSSGAWWPAIPN